MRQDLRLEEVLGDFTSARLSNLVMREIKLRDRLVEHEALDQDANQVIIDQVAGQGEVGEGGRRPQAVLERRGIGHLHAEQGPLVLHAHVLGAVSERQVAQVWQVLEDQVNLEFLQLRDDQTEDLVSGRVKLLLHLLEVGGFAIRLQQGLDVSLDVRLLETVTVFLTFDVLVGHLITLQALLLPVEL